MKPLYIQVLLLGVLSCIFAACNGTTNKPLECTGEGSYKYAECNTCCMCFRANMGNSFNEALDSVQRVDRIFFQDLMDNYNVDFSKSYLHFDTLHVLDFSLDERKFIQVWYYGYIEDYQEAMPTFDYGVVDTKGDVYNINYPND